MVSAMTACSARAGLRPGRSRLEAAQRTIKASRALRRVSTSATSLRLTILEPNPRQRLELAVNLVRTTPSLAASSHRSAASPRVARVGARSVPRRGATWESRRQALASATVAKVVRIGRRSRADQTWAWKMGVQVQESPSAKSSGGRGEPGRPRGGGGEGRSLPGSLTRDDRRARPREGVEHRVAGGARVSKRDLDELERLHRRVLARGPRARDLEHRGGGIVSEPVGSESGPRWREGNESQSSPFPLADAGG